MVEQRKFVRLHAPLGVHYRIIQKNKKTREVSSWLKNISGGGVRIVTQHPLKTGELLHLKIQIPHLEEPTEAVGEVVWVNSNGKDGQQIHEAGIRFCDVDPAELNKILEYVHAIGIG